MWPLRYACYWHEGPQIICKHKETIRSWVVLKSHSRKMCATKLLYKMTYAKSGGISGSMQADQVSASRIGSKTTWGPTSIVEPNVLNLSPTELKMLSSLRELSYGKTSYQSSLLFVLWMVGLVDEHKDKCLQWDRWRAIHMLVQEEHGSPPKSNIWVLKDSSVINNDHTIWSNKLMINTLV